jgi:hypothetical protein
VGSDPVRMFPTFTANGWLHYHSRMRRLMAHGCGGGGTSRQVTCVLVLPPKDARRWTVAVRMLSVISIVSCSHDGSQKSFGRL